MKTNPKDEAAVEATNAEPKKSGLGTSQKIAIAIGIGVLVAGGIAGGVYLATHHGDSESATIAVSDSTSNNVASTSSGSNVLVDGKNKITSGGTYTFTGSTSNGKIVVDTTEEVKIILNGVSITNPEGAAIKCQEGSKVTIELVGENTLTSTDQGDSTDGPAGAVSSDGDLIMTGSGSATISSNGDGIHADGMLQIDSGTFNITATEGLEATYVKINGGDITINASDDGINASNKSTAYSVSLEINGGTLTIVMGQGDTDALDSNGTLIINGGTINITTQSPFDYETSAEYNGGTLIVNGETVTTITNQFEGGMGGGMMPGQQGQQQMQQGTQNAQQDQQPPQQSGRGMMMR